MSLRLETFLSGSRDFEARQYLVLQGLKDHHALFCRNRLYPSLSELVDLYGVLQTLLQRREDMQNHLPQHLKEVDVEHMQLVYEQTQPDYADL